MEAEGIRARNRQALMAAIITSANQQLREVGPAALSVRAVARDLGMASSAVYRYVASRDELLTLLIVGGYNAMADEVEAAAGREADPAKRFRVIALACRQWALSDPHTFSLIYGSPVPGYAAPQDTIAPATRIPVLLVTILAELGTQPQPPAFTARVARSMRPVLEATAQWGLGGYSDAALALGVMTWTHIIGSISFELFGHRHNVIGDSEADRRAYFEFEMETLEGLLGIADR